LTLVFVVLQGIWLASKLPKDDAAARDKTKPVNPR